MCFGVNIYLISSSLLLYNAAFTNLVNKILFSDMLFFSSKIYNCYIQSFYVSPKVSYLLILTSFPVNFLAYLS